MLKFYNLTPFPGYRQIKMDESCKRFTNFVTSTSTLQFKVVPFGLMNVVFTFQRMMDALLKNISFAQAYLDSVLVYLRAMDAHISHL